MAGPSIQKTWEIVFDSGGVRLWGVFNRAASGHGGQPLVVMVTGADPIGSASATWHALRAECDRLSVAWFLFDFPGQGNSPGSIADLNLTVGVAVLRDALAMVRAQQWVDTSRVALVGESFGGNVCLLHAAQDQTIWRIGLQCPASMWAESLELLLGDEGVARWKDGDRTHTSGFSYQAYVDSLSYNTYEAARSVRCPVLIVHGSADALVPARHSKRLVECLPNAQLVTLDNVDHSFSQPGALATSTRLITDWLTSDQRPTEETADDHVDNSLPT